MSPTTRWAAFRSARADLERVLDDPDRADTVYDGMFGRTTVSATVDQFMGFDLVVHGWDLARATSQDETIPERRGRPHPRFVDRMGTATMRENGVTGPEVAVPDDAPEQDRMLGLLGRTPPDHASDGWLRCDERRAAARRWRSPMRRPRRTSGAGSSMSEALASRYATASSQNAMTSAAPPGGEEVLHGVEHAVHVGGPVARRQVGGRSAGRGRWRRGVRSPRTRRS